MGIRLTATVSSALQRRRRNHRSEIFNIIEAVMEQQRSNLTNTADYSIWKSSSDTYKSVFTTKNTWNLLHQEGTTVEWCKGLFKHHTPKFAFFTWLALHNRLSTGDRMLQWNAGVSSACIFCNQFETRDHIFFSCTYSAAVWSQLMRGLLRTRYTTIWTEVLELTLDNSLGMITTFLTRYVFQITIHILWRERNDRRHGATPISVQALVKMLDRQIRNKCLSFRQLGDFTYAASLSDWFATR
ncbi:uncharacterized protein LOC106453535 [Brassica napus]|uniref:uncharacterized protein LOC106453535 n=1 Tax=Brassica napus TaxID=3708 RepID=UPI0006AAE3A8|nr:uncharacterized protein LOC106453535 [Brassica napus]